MGDQNINNDRLAELVFKQLLRQLSDEETTELEQWRMFSPGNELAYHELTERARLRLDLEEYNQVDGERIWRKITNEVPELNAPVVRQHKNKYVWFRIAAAAAVLIAILIGGWLFFANGFKKGNSQQPVAETKDISPGGNRAILTLSDGSTVVLDSAQRGVLAHQGKTRISKKQEGEVVYNANHSAGSEEPLTYNTITTPRGGQYHVVLPDGSDVWLNAASSIHFPTQFTGKERKVTISGEAYFEVARDKAKPFKVVVSPAGSDVCEIEVLGTHFNVNAYSNEGYANATLLEGKISLTANEKQATLLPGQQATVNKGNNNVAVRNSESAESAIAWVKGVFHFEKADVGSVMRQLSRWYDVDVVYEGEIPEQKITGDAERNIPLSELLPILEQISKTHFRIQGRSIRVSP
jgi:ferric-dicitrate binding protein FerR (iron transport regulator)